MLNFVNIHDEQKSITAFSKGVKEYEVIGTDYKKLALTLFRAVGYLGKPDLVRRPGVASGNQFKYIEAQIVNYNKILNLSFLSQWVKISRRLTLSIIIINTQ